jgi:hypothetical protein
MRERKMLKHLLRTCSLVILIALATMPPSAGLADEKSASQIQEEVWGMLLPLPILAYLVRPVGPGPFPLVIMNYGVSFDQQEGSFYPPFGDAAHWFARRGYVVVAPIGPSSSGGAGDLPERELYKLYFSAIGDCDDPNFQATLSGYGTSRNSAAPQKSIAIGGQRKWPDLSLARPGRE